MSDVAPPNTGALPPGFAERVGWTADARERLEAYRRLLEAGNQQTNLVGASTLEHFWRRHVLDSAQLIWFAPDAVRWADLGAGAGLPGVVLAILLRGRPGATIHLVESMAKRCRFLQDVVQRLELPAVIHNARAESLNLKVQMITARALAPLDRLLEYAAPNAAGGAGMLFLKGEQAPTEIKEARRRWRFDAAIHASLSDPRGQVLEISGLRRVR